MKALLVEDLLNFKRDGNPLSSMGLGGFSFETLKPGAILRSKRFFGVTKSTGVIGGYHSSAIRIGKDNYLLITEVRDSFKPKLKTLTFKRYGTLEHAKSEKEKFKEGGSKKLDWYGVGSGFFSGMSKMKFDYRFEIIEPGFSLAESQNFERGQDPKRAMGLGRPFGFTSSLLDLSANTGNNSFYITPEFAKKILETTNFRKWNWPKEFVDVKNLRWGYRKKDYYDEEKEGYKGAYSITIKFYGYDDLFKAGGMSGDFGFGGLQSTRARIIGKTYRKSIYEQLYKKIEKVWLKGISESLDFDRTGTPYEKLGLGKSFLTLKPGQILKPKGIIYIGARTQFDPKGRTKIWEESYAVVIRSEKTPGGKLKVYYYQAWDLAQAKVVAENIDIYQNMGNNSMTGSVKQFENRFEIL
jgi:hypothetical protein